MNGWALAFALLVLFSGCIEDPGTTTPTGGTDVPTGLPAKQVFVKEGNNAQCTDVLTGNQNFAFTVDPGYTHLEITWHASGLGNVGFEVRGPNGTVMSVEDYNPADQPCNHSHSAAPETHLAGPGAYSVVVRNQGILGWHLQINEIVGTNTTAHQH